MRRFIKYLIAKVQAQKSKWYNRKFHFLLWINGIDTYGVNACNGCPIIEIQKGAKVEFGRNIWLNNYLYTSWNARCKIYVGENAILSIGNDTGLNGTLIYCSQKIEIGQHVAIGGGTRIFDTDFHPLDWALRRRTSKNEYIQKSPITIEDDVFIGTGCIIGKGVTIGARSIIGAGSVVTKSIPPDCIAAGSPCRVIRSLC